MSSPADVVRGFYQARASRDPGAIRQLLADAVAWRRPAQVDTVEYHTADEVVASFGRFWDFAKPGAIETEPLECVETATTVAFLVRWTVKSASRRFQGYELAVYEVADGRITEALFLPDFSFADITRVLAR